MALSMMSVVFFILILSSAYSTTTLATDASLNGTISMLKPPPFHMEIFVFAYDRLESLKRLWASLETSDYLGHNVSMSIMQDFAPKKNVTDLDHWLATLRWPHGNFILHKNKENVGLRKNIQGAWNPSDPNTFGTFLEDDIEVSPFWYVWASNAIQKYYYDSGPQPKLAGFSLFRPNYNVLIRQDMNWSTQGQPVIFQQPQSWGQVLCPRHWRYFLAWQVQFTKPTIKQLWLRSNLWDPRKTWKKVLIRMMFDDGLFFIYPNFLNDMSLSTHHMEQGEHFRPNSKRLARNRVPLLDREQVKKWMAGGYDPFAMPAIDKLQVFNMVGFRVKSRSEIYHGGAKLPKGYLFPFERENVDYEWYDDKVVMRSNHDSLPISKKQCHENSMGICRD